MNEGRSGQTGSMVLDLPFTNRASFEVQGARALVASTLPVSDAVPLAAIRRLLAAPDGFYLSVTTAANPGGIARAPNAMS